MTDRVGTIHFAVLLRKSQRVMLLVKEQCANPASATRYFFLSAFSLRRGWRTSSCVYTADSAERCVFFFVYL